MAKTERACLRKRLAAGYEYTVREGDTLADVLRVTGASVCELKARNARCDVFHLRPGQRLRVSVVIPPAARTYRVHRGEDIYALARKFDRSVISLLRVNSHLLPAEIRPGALIVLPKE
jgi:LysM repeat protein